MLVNNLGHQNRKLPVSEEIAKSLTNITWSFFYESSLMSLIFLQYGLVRSAVRLVRLPPHPSYSWNSALATSNTSHSIHNFNYLLQFHLWNSPSVSVRSPSTLYSSKTITICIWHTNLCHPPCKHKNIWWKVFFLFWPICLEQFASNIPPLWFYLLFQSRPQDAPV